MNTGQKILVVDDERVALRNLAHVLRRQGYEVTGSQSGAKALQLLEDQKFDVVLADLKMPKVSGLCILKRAKEINPDTEVIMITGYASVETAIEAMRAGAYHYVSKPFKIDKVRRIVAQALERKQRRCVKEDKKHQRKQIKGFDIVAISASMKKVVEIAEKAAQSDCTVLITGESGTGKETFAHYIHKLSRRSDGPMVVVNCGVFSEAQLAQKLFGQQVESITIEKGLIETANGGTILLNEITEIAPSMQVRLLRVLQERQITRIGARNPIDVDVRFIFATNKDIRYMVEKGLFRQDLYFRINVVNIDLPPLSHRKQDLPILIDMFVKRYARISDKHIKGIEPNAMEMLQEYEYPGNIKELQRLIERAVSLCKGDIIKPEYLPDINVMTYRPVKGRWPTLDELEKDYIKWVLDHMDWNRTRAAEVLGIDRVSLWRKIKRYELQ